MDSSNQYTAQIKAAAYVRMSTDLQKYSPENQMDAIKDYANKNGYQIIQEYFDKGKSGLTIKGRTALQQMISDVENKRAEYKTILVLDVSRWGRFQNPDQAAYLEYTFYLAGINVQYCAEQFQNDNSLPSTIIKNNMRFMAGLFSKELSGKVFAGQARLITLGYRQGGPAGYGLRRMLLDEHGNPIKQLSRGQHKSITVERVILVPGPPEEIKNVNWMYNAFVNDGKSESEIANFLNEQGIVTDFNRPWNSGTVKGVLSNEKYIGNNVFNRKSFKLKAFRFKNHYDDWIRKNGAFKAIVNKEIFDKAQSIFMERCLRFSDEEMLEKLKKLKEQKGYLSAIIINEAENMPSSAAYAGRFGGLIKAYKLIGFTPERDFHYIEINKALRDFHSNILEKTIATLISLGAYVTLASNNLLNINNMITVSIVICRCSKTPSSAYRWKILFDTSLKPDITIAVRMDNVNERILDYYILPALDFNTSNTQLKEINSDFLDSYRFDNLNHLFELSKIVSLLELS